LETYRLYFMSADGSHIDRFEPIEAHDDADAIHFAEIYIGRQALELWLKGRRVFAFESRSFDASHAPGLPGDARQRGFAPVAPA